MKRKKKLKRLDEEIRKPTAKPSRIFKTRKKELSRKAKYKGKEDYQE